MLCILETFLRIVPSRNKRWHNCFCREIPFTSRNREAKATAKTIPLLNHLSITLHHSTFQSMLQQAFTLCCMLQTGKQDMRWMKRKHIFNISTTLLAIVLRFQRFQHSNGRYHRGNFGSQWRLRVAIVQVGFDSVTQRLALRLRNATNASWNVEPNAGARSSFTILVSIARSCKQITRNKQPFILGNV